MLFLCPACGSTGNGISDSSLTAETELLKQQEKDILAVKKESEKKKGLNTIKPKDMISIQVWLKDKKTQFSGFPYVHTIPQNGEIFIPDVGLVKITGKTGDEIKTTLSEHFSRILNNPTVVVEHTRYEPPVTAVTADVERPNVILLGHAGQGIFPIKPGTTIREVIATGGGFKDFANRRKVYVVRGTAEHPQVIIVNMVDVMTGEDLSQNIELLPNDAIYVPPVGMWKVYDVIRKGLLPITAIRDSVFIIPQ